ncbi:hypothetical protein K504DRAFT_180288 [Pleomassaria siparia CBS 279.74]|uniref:Uncharacterized protein n=1 Tax=Pleomassaria siparia CBS 279.74 TaxID=1314801 RepID=A0A6G1JSF8_9PLEO|nr:hypothetical protein K504DRAFT_180288 [Pleomassaria siparia CBS 279.74]
MPVSRLLAHSINHRQSKFTVPKRLYQATNKRFDDRSSLRRNDGQVIGDTIRRRFSPTKRPVTVAPSLNTVPRRCFHFESSQLRKRTKPVSGALKPRGVSKRAGGRLCKARLNIREKLKVTPSPVGRLDRMWERWEMLGKLGPDGEILRIVDPFELDLISPDSIEERRTELFEKSPLKEEVKVQQLEELEEKKKQQLNDLLQQMLKDEQEEEQRYFEVEQRRQETEDTSLEMEDDIGVDLMARVWDLDTDFELGSDTEPDSDADSDGDDSGASDCEEDMDMNIEDDDDEGFMSEIDPEQVEAMRAARDRALMDPYCQMFASRGRW